MIDGTDRKVKPDLGIGPGVEQAGMRRSAALISSLTVTSRIAGFARDVLSARMFGTSLYWDAFLVAFQIPNLLRRLFGEGALSAAFIPVFSEYLEKKKGDEAWKVASITVCYAAAALSLIVAAGVTVAWLAYSFLDLGQEYSLIFGLLRVLWPYCLFVCIAAVCMAILHSLKHFVAPALASTALNVVWILAIVFICPLFYPDTRKMVYALAGCVLFGGVMQVAIQLPVMKKKGVRFTFSLDAGHPAIRTISRLYVPTVIGMAVVPVNVLVDQLLALWLGEGMVSSLWWSNRVVQFPLGIFGIAMATAALPTMSVQVARNEFDSLKRTFQTGLKGVLFVLLPCSSALVVLKVPVIRLLFERGQFSEVSTAETAYALGFYSLGLFVYGSIKVTVQVFYSLKDPGTPVKAAIVAMVANVILNLTLMWPLRQGGLALATVLSSTLNLGILLAVLARKIGDPGWKSLAWATVRMAFSALVMAVCCRFVLGFFLAREMTFVNKAACVFVPGIAGCAVYFAACVLSGVDESREIWRWISRRR